MTRSAYHRTGVFQVLSSVVVFFSSAALAANDAPEKLLVRSGTLIELTGTRVVLKVGGQRRPPRITFAINVCAQLDAAAPGQTVTVIYARRKPMDVVVRLIVQHDRPSGSTKAPDTSSETFGVASVGTSTEEKVLSDRDSAQIMAIAQVIQPNSSPGRPTRTYVVRDYHGFDVSHDKSGNGVSAMSAGSRSAAVPSATLLAPRRAKFYGASADFLWSFTGHSEGYLLLITDKDETQIVRQQLNAPRYRFDVPVSKLQPGETYFWRVQVLPNSLASEPLEFVVVSAAERQAIGQAIVAISVCDPYQAGLARAHIFTDHGLWFDTLGAYNELIAKFPDRPELYEERGAIYAQIPMTKALSDADLARAAQLHK